MTIRELEDEVLLRSVAMAGWERDAREYFTEALRRLTQAKADADRLEWLDTQPFTAYHDDNAPADDMRIVVVSAAPTGERTVGTAATFREAVDRAMSGEVSDRASDKEQAEVVSEKG